MDFLFCRFINQVQEEEVSVLQIPNPRTWTRVFLQRLHQQREAPAAVQNVKPNRSPGEDLVSEQENEGEKTQSWSPTVFYWKPFILIYEAYIKIQRHTDWTEEASWYWINMLQHNLPHILDDLYRYLKIFIHLLAS